MIKCQRFSMQCLTGKNFKTIFNKLLVLGKCCAFKYLISTILLIVKQRMFYMTEMNTDLVGSPCFQFAFDEGNITEILKNLIMSYSSFSFLLSLKTCIIFLSFMLLPTFPVIVPSGGSGIPHTSALYLLSVVRS